VDVVRSTTRRRPALSAATPLLSSALVRSIVFYNIRPKQDRVELDLDQQYPPGNDSLERVLLVWTSLIISIDKDSAQQ